MAFLWTAPGSPAVTRHVDIPAPIHSDAIGVIVAGRTEEGIPHQAAAAVQLGGKGIHAPGVTVLWTAPGGLTIPRHVDIPAPIHGDAIGDIIAGRTQEGVPFQRGIDSQGVGGVVGGKGEMNQPPLCLPRFRRGGGLIDFKSHIDRHTLAFNFLPGHRRAGGHLTSLEFEDQVAALVDLHRDVVAQGNLIGVSARRNLVSAAQNTPRRAVVDQGDPWPKVGVGDRIQ